MQPADPIRQIWQYLHELRDHEDVSDFTRAYYALIADRLSELGVQGAGLRRAFAAHLRQETRFLRATGNLAQPDGVESRDMRIATNKRDIALRETLHCLSECACEAGAHLALCHLMAAQCHYHLQEYDAVIERLEDAVASGADDPLVHFALGYNIYAQAERTLTIPVDQTDELVVTDPVAYRSQLLRAVSAFERGLTGGDMDPNLYWWIGTCLQQAGFESAATHAFSQAKGVVAEADSQHTDVPDHEADRADALRLGEISPTEIRHVVELLKRSYTIADVLGRSGS